MSVLFGVVVTLCGGRGNAEECGESGVGWN